jgi:hypothetical protein
MEIVHDLAKDVGSRSAAGQILENDTPHVRLGGALRNAERVFCSDLGVHVEIDGAGHGRLVAVTQQRLELVADVVRLHNAARHWLHRGSPSMV